MWFGDRSVFLNGCPMEKETVECFISGTAGGYRTWLESYVAGIHCGMGYAQYCTEWAGISTLRRAMWHEEMGT